MIKRDYVNDSICIGTTSYDCDNAVEIEIGLQIYKKGLIIVLCEDDARGLMRSLSMVLAHIEQSKK